MKTIPILYADDPEKIRRLSSITQHRNKFSVYAQGGWLPVSYDVLESIVCNKIKSHRAIMTDDAHDIGYIFPTATCSKEQIAYLLSDKYGFEIDELPAWYGTGLFQKFIDEYALTEADNHPLGVKNKINYKIGLDYYLAKETIEGDA